MTKKVKIGIVLATSSALLVYWAALFFTHTKEEMINYWWQAFLALAAILYGIFGIMTAKHWGMLKSSVGKSVFAISLGLIMWGIGQAGWTYFVIKDPSQQSPPSDIVSFLYILSIPLWAYGIIKLSKASGAKYGLKSTTAKVAVVFMTLLLFALSYYFLVVIARGGVSYFHQKFDVIFYDLGYAVGDAINLILALAIYGLSWKYLGGRFKKPILVLLLSFALIYLADFWFSFRDGQDLYYNGDWTDLLYLFMTATFGLGLCMLDPSNMRKPAKQQANTADNQTTQVSVPEAGSTVTGETNTANTQGHVEPTPPAEQSPDNNPTEPINNENNGGTS